MFFVITCTGPHPVVGTPPQPAEPPVGTQTDTPTSLPPSSESTKHPQHTNAVSADEREGSLAKGGAAWEQ